MNGTVPLPDTAKTLEEQTDDILLACLLWGEARGETPEAQYAVGCVVRNRVLAGRYGGNTWKGVILRPKQFSCFNPQDINRKKLLDPLEWDKPAVWERCYAVARSILDGEALDTTKRSTHYHDKTLDLRPPFWAKVFKATVSIGDLRFFRDPKAFYDPEPPHDVPIAHFGES